MTQHNNQYCGGGTKLFRRRTAGVAVQQQVTATTSPTAANCKSACAAMSDCKFVVGYFGGEAGTPGIAAHRRRWCNLKKNDCNSGNGRATDTIHRRATFEFPGMTE